MLRTLSVMALVSIALFMPAIATATETLDWSAQTPGTVAIGTPRVITVGGITVTTTKVSQSPAASWNVAPQVTVNSAAADKLDLFMDAVAPGAFVEVSFTFSRPVTNLCFTVENVNGSNTAANGWSDTVQITGTSPAQTPTGAPAPGTSWSTAGSTGTAQGTSLSLDGGVVVCFPNDITTVTIRYLAGPGIDLTPQEQFVSISDLTWASGTVSVQKITQGGTGGEFTFTQTNLLTTPAGISTTVTGTQTPALPTAHEINAPGNNVTLTENLAAGFQFTSATCNDSNSTATGNTNPVGSLSGTTFTFNASTMVLSGANIACTYVNTRQIVADLMVTKTNTPANGALDQSSDTLSSGATTAYSIVVKNNGPDAVTGAILKDPIASRTGLTCTTQPTCTGTACPAGPLTIAGLDSGLVLGTLANGASMTVTLTCTVQ